MHLRQALDQSMQTQTTQFVAHAAGRDVTGTLPQRHREDLPEILVGESLRQKDEHE